MSEHRMQDPVEYGIEGEDAATGAALHYLPWDADPDLRLWVGQYASANECAISVMSLDTERLLLRFTRAQLREWHTWMGHMLDAADEADRDAAEDAEARR